MISTKQARYQAVHREEQDDATQHDVRPQRQGCLQWLINLVRRFFQRLRRIFCCGDEPREKPERKTLTEDSLGKDEAEAVEEGEGERGGGKEGMTEEGGNGGGGRKPANDLPEHVGKKCEDEAVAASADSAPSPARYEEIEDSVVKAAAATSSQEPETAVAVVGVCSGKTSAVTTEPSLGVVAKNMHDFADESAEKSNFTSLNAPRRLSIEAEIAPSKDESVQRTYAVATVESKPEKEKEPDAVQQPVEIAEADKQQTEAEPVDLEAQEPDVVEQQGDQAGADKQAEPQPAAVEEPLKPESSAREELKEPSEREKPGVFGIFVADRQGSVEEKPRPPEWGPTTPEPDKSVVKFQQKFWAVVPADSLAAQDKPVGFAITTEDEGKTQETAAKAENNNDAFSQRNDANGKQAESPDVESCDKDKEENEEAGEPLQNGGQSPPNVDANGFEGAIQKNQQDVLRQELQAENELAEPPIVISENMTEPTSATVQESAEPEPYEEEQPTDQTLGEPIGEPVEPEPIDERAQPESVSFPETIEPITMVAEVVAELEPPVEQLNTEADEESVQAEPAEEPVTPDATAGEKSKLEPTPFKVEPEIADTEPDQKPSEAEPEPKPALAEPAGEPAKTQSTGEPERAEEPAEVEPAEESAKTESNEEPAELETNPALAEPTGVPAEAEPAEESAEEPEQPETGTAPAAATSPTVAPPSVSPPPAAAVAVLRAPDWFDPTLNPFDNCGVTADRINRASVSKLRRRVSSEEIKCLYSDHPLGILSENRDF